MESWQQCAANAIFTLLVIVTVVPAILVVLTQHIVRAACWLLLSLTGAAGLFFFLGADFVGAVQLLIYVGGTLVLVIFGVMLTATGPFVNMRGRSGDWAMAILTGFAMMAVMVYALAGGRWNEQSLYAEQEISATTTRIGMALLGNPETNPTPGRGEPSEELGQIAPPEHFATGYLLPFEIISFHLVVVLVGAAYLARAKQRRGTQTQGTAAA